MICTKDRDRFVGSAEVQLAEVALLDQVAELLFEGKVPLTPESVGNEEGTGSVFSIGLRDIH